MNTFVDKDGAYHLPTGWHEVTTRQFCDIDRLRFRTVEARASYFAGRPISVNGLVADCLAFMLTPPTTEGGHRYPADLGQETYLQVETIKSLLSTQPLHECYAEVYGNFRARLLQYSSDTDFSQARAARYAELCLSWPVTDTYPAIKHCLAELERLNTKYAMLSEPDHTEAGRRAREAGANRLDIFGHLNVATYYAKEFSVTIDAFYQWPWETVALMLCKDRIQAEVNDNLSRQTS